MATDDYARWLAVLQDIHGVTERLRLQLGMASAAQEARSYCQIVDVWVDRTRGRLAPGRMVHVDVQRIKGLQQRMSDVAAGRARAPTPKLPGGEFVVLYDILGETYRGLLSALPGESEVEPPPPPPKMLSTP